MKRTLGVVLGLAFAARGSAAIQYFHWDKPHHGDRGNVTALDLASRKVVWEASAGKSVNFVHETGAGVVVGNDEGEGRPPGQEQRQGDLAMPPGKARRDQDAHRRYR